VPPGRLHSSTRSPHQLRNRSGLLRSGSSASSESLRRLFRPAIAVTRLRFSKRGPPCGDQPLSLAALRRRCEPLDELLLVRLFCSTTSNVITRWSVLVCRQPLQAFRCCRTAWALFWRPQVSFPSVDFPSQGAPFVRCGLLDFPLFPRELPV